KDLRDLLISMLKKRDQWLRIINGASTATETELERLRVELQAALRRAVEEELREIRREVESALGADANELVRLAGIASGGTAGGRAGLPEASAEKLDEWRAIAQLTLTDKGQVRKSITIKD